MSEDAFAWRKSAEHIVHNITIIRAVLVIADDNCPVANTPDLYHKPNSTQNIFTSLPEVFDFNQNSLNRHHIIIRVGITVKTGTDMAKPIITLNGLKIVIGAGNAGGCSERYPPPQISLFPLFCYVIYCSRSQFRCATDDPMPNSRVILPYHCSQTLLC